tara:strand:+ start:40 stop:255 length:216 start_codon:yes stop_codon:yes gene_type:complete
MLKKRKDRNFDERHDGARELNQAKGFLGGILGFLAIFKDIKALAKGREKLYKKNVKTQADKERFDQLRRMK